MRILAAIPCYNERVAIGSGDGTAAVAREAGATVISHEQNRGKGAA